MQTDGSSSASSDSLLAKYAAQIQAGLSVHDQVGAQLVTPGQIVYDDQNQSYYILLGTPSDLTDQPVSIDLSNTAQYSIATRQRLSWCPSSTPYWATEFTSLSNSETQLLTDLTNFGATESDGDKGTGSTSTAVGAIFVLNTITDASSASETGAAITGGNLAESTTDSDGRHRRSPPRIKAPSRPRTTAPSRRSPARQVQQPRAAGEIAVNGIVATNNILFASTQAFASGGSLTAYGTAGAVDVTALSNASINSENSASTDGDTTSVGVVLAFNTIGIPLSAAGFLENTVDTLIGTHLAGQQPDQVYAYIDGATTSAGDGVSVQATEDSTITANISNSETGLFSSGTSVAATLTLNEVATDVEAWIAGGKTTATAATSTSKPRASRPSRPR